MYVCMDIEFKCTVHLDSIKMGFICVEQWTQQLALQQGEQLPERSKPTQAENKCTYVYK